MESIAEVKELEQESDSHGLEVGKRCETPMELMLRVDEYFRDSEKRDVPTQSGLIRYCGWKTPAMFSKLSERGEGWGEAVAYAKLRIIQGWEEQLHGKSPTGAIFALKQYGWKDTPTIVQSKYTNLTQLVDLGACSEEELLDKLSQRLLSDAAQATNGQARP